MSIDFDQLEDSPYLLDILLQIEDVLDSLDIYVFRNWFSGAVIDGPRVRRYWIDCTLRYDYHKMPDPRAGMRLIKHGIRVAFSKGTEEAATDKSPEGEGETVEQTSQCWLVKLSMPRRLISQMSSAELDFYDDEIDAEDVQDARDDGIDDESGYDAREQNENGGEPLPGMGGAEEMHNG